MFLNNHKNDPCKNYKPASGKDPHTMRVKLAMKGMQYNEKDPLGILGYHWDKRIGGWVNSMNLLETINEIKERAKDGLFKDKKIIPHLIAHDTKNEIDVYFFVINVIDYLY